jgi:hypothetical protein
LNSCRIKEFLDFRGSKVFKDATNDPIITVLEKSQNIEDNVINVVVIKGDLEAQQVIAMAKEKLGTDYIDENILSYQCEQGKMLEKVYTEKDTGKKFIVSWNLSPTHVHSVLAKIKEDSTYLLKDLCDVSYGIRPGNTDVFRFTENKAKELNLEKELLKPLLEGEDVRRFKINYRNLYILYTTRDVDIDKFPKVKEYLLRFKSNLENRAQYKQRKEKGEDIKWYELEQPVSTKIFNSTKILTPDISEINNFLTSHLGIRLEKVECIVIFDRVTKMPNERENYADIVKRGLK